MPVPPGTVTNEIVQRLPRLVDEYNRQETKYINSYNRFMQDREELLTMHNGIFTSLLKDESFINRLRRALVDFGLDARGSELASVEQILNTTGKVGPEFDLLRSESTSLHTLNPFHRNNDQTVDSVVRKIFNHFAEPGSITEAGGFVAASKPSHFIMPEVFVIVDGQHIAISLYNIQDYRPHPHDGTYWRDVISNYSGNTPNPSPRGEGRRSWDAERYVIALMYYKRIIREWCDRNGTNVEGFSDLDARNASQPSRIVDKTLW